MLESGQLFDALPALSKEEKVADDAEITDDLSRELPVASLSD